MRNSGYIVETKSGKVGRTYHNEPMINGKKPVHIDIDGKTVKMLCDPNSLKLKGFSD
jgi:hypothetical protein